MSKKLFDYLDDITVRKTPLECEDVKGYSPFIINTFVSSVQGLVLLVNEVNKCGLLPKEAHYDLMSCAIPQRQYRFSNFAKKKAVVSEQVECLCRYFEIGVKEATMYLGIMSEEQIQEICSKYDTK